MIASMFHFDTDAATMSVWLFGLMVALGAGLSFWFFCFNARRNGLNAGTGPLTYFLGIPVSLLLSRLMFCLLDASYTSITDLRHFFRLNDGGYALFGVLIGMTLTAAFCALLLKQRPSETLDALCPSLFLFIFFERLGEGFIRDFGISRSLIYGTLQGTFLVQQDMDLYLRTWILEAVIALILFVVILRIEAVDVRPGYVFLKACMLFGATQVLMESLRYDSHLMFSFVGVQHVLSMAVLGIPVLILAKRALKTNKGLALAGFIMIPVVVGLLIFLEFQIDRTETNRYLLYGIYALALAAPTVVGFLLAGNE